MNEPIIGTRCGEAPVPLSILDFAMAGQGRSAHEALAASVDLARLVDRRGFTRYWVAEHHSMPGVTTSGPRSCCPASSARPAGSGWVGWDDAPELPAPGRCRTVRPAGLARPRPAASTSGVGRAPGTDPLTAGALRRGQLNAADFPQRLGELLGFLDDDFPPDHAFSSSVHAVPGPRQDRENGIPRSVPRPPVWLLGSSGYSAGLAAELGFPFAFAAHLADENLMAALSHYRSSFRASTVLERPYAIVSFGVLAADDPQEADRQATLPWSCSRSITAGLSIGMASAFASDWLLGRRGGAGTPCPPGALMRPPPCRSPRAGTQMRSRSAAGRERGRLLGRQWSGRAPAAASGSSCVVSVGMW